jgi:heterodisulfide reductase subunit C
MKVTHKFPVVCACPVDARQDVYDCTVETNRTVKVEDILAAAQRATAKPAFQEDITERLAADLGCRVMTIGRHSNVETTVTSGDDE